MSIKYSSLLSAKVEPMPGNEYLIVTQVKPVRSKKAGPIVIMKIASQPKLATPDLDEWFGQTDPAQRAREYRL